MNTNDDQLDDLKQFVANTVGQAEARLSERLQRVEDGLGTLRQEVSDGFAGSGDATEMIHSVLDEHDLRLKKLEGQPA